MNRRGFLGLLGAASAGFALDPERLLWRPGQRTFFLPAPKTFRAGSWVWVRLTDGPYVNPYHLIPLTGDGPPLGRVLGVVEDYAATESPRVTTFGRDFERMLFGS